MTLNIGQLLEDAKVIRQRFIDSHEIAIMKGLVDYEDPTDDEDVQRIDRIIAYFQERYVPPSEPGSYKLARGIFQWTEGDEPAEESIRRIRGG